MFGQADRFHRTHQTWQWRCLQNKINQTLKKEASIIIMQRTASFHPSGHCKQDIRGLTKNASYTYMYICTVHVQAHGGSFTSARIVRLRACTLSDGTDKDFVRHRVRQHGDSSCWTCTRGCLRPTVTYAGSRQVQKTCHSVWAPKRWTRSDLYKSTPGPMFFLFCFLGCSREITSF